MQYKLESLRGMAACMVVLFHSPFNFGVNQLEFFSNSYLFVDFFFILSGYVMALAYGDKIKNGLSFRTYFFLRLGRIYPLHLFLLFVWVPYICLKQYLYMSGYGGSDQFEHNNALSFASNVFLVNSMGVHDYLSWNNPSWSISTEFFAYILFFFVSITFDRRDSVFIPCLIAIAGYSFLWSLDRNNLDITYDYGFVRCVSAFYMGVLIFRISRRFRIYELGSRQSTFLEILSVVLVILSVSMVDDFQDSFYVLASFVFLISVFSTEEGGLVGSFLTSKAPRSLGLWSYSIYMVHALILAVFSNIFEFVLGWNLSQGLGFLSLAINLNIMLIIVLISKYTYELIETPLRSRSREFVESLNERAFNKN